MPFMSRFDPHKHNRRSIRLPGWDYRAAAIYFVTICTHGRECFFDDPAWATVATTAWTAIPQHAGRVALDEWVLMPNHLHAILVLTDEPADATDTSSFDIRWASLLPTPEPRRFANVPSGSLGSIIRSYKAAVTRRINERCRTPGQPRWQRGYYERVVRDDRELERIRAYIRENPARWAKDRDNLDAVLDRMVRNGR